jgi:hypothetical protein
MPCSELAIAWFAFHASNIARPITVVNGLNTGMEHDRWVVSSWGRAGSVALALRLRLHLARQHAVGSVPWIYLGPHGVRVDLPAPSVCHNHSIEQLEALAECQLVHGHAIALRRPSWAALSSVLIMDTGYSHHYIHGHYNACLVDLMADAAGTDREYCSRVVAQYHARGRRQRARVDMEALRYHRWIAMNWNDIAAVVSPRMAGSRRALDHDAWVDDPDLALRDLGLASLPADAYLAVARDDWPIMDRMENPDEVLAWIAQHEDEDRSCMAAWMAAINGSSP